jgi:hypothetical protein
MKTAGNNIDTSLDFTIQLAKENKLITLKLKSSDKTLTGYVVGFRAFPKQEISSWEFVLADTIEQYNSATSLEDKRIFTSKIPLSTVEKIIEIREV